ncbi:MAG: matrixin family metalloprotease [Firmicutes bacterium]|nr:matrixin family metalloprotease [Bacillota bacterium]
MSIFHLLRFRQAPTLDKSHFLLTKYRGLGGPGGPAAARGRQGRPFGRQAIDLNTYYTAGYSTTHVEAISGHELGHALGLAHNPTCPVLMNPDDAYTTCDIYTPQQDDINGVNAIYGAP